VLHHGCRGKAMSMAESGWGSGDKKRQFGEGGWGGRLLGGEGTERN